MQRERDLRVQSRRSVQGKDGEYELAVTVTEVSKPVFGGSLTVGVETGWSLVKLADKKVLMRKVIKSSHTATIGDALAAVTRVRLAEEGAVRNNIEQGMREIAALGSLE